MSEHDDTPAPPQSSGWTPVVPLGGTHTEPPPMSATQGSPQPPPSPTAIPYPTPVQPAAGPSSSSNTAASTSAASAPAASAPAAARVVAGVMGLIGGLLIVGGSFLDWVRADIVGEGISFGSGWSNVSGSLADGPIIAVLGALVAVWGAITLVAPITGRWVLAGFVASGAATAIVVYEIVDLSSPGPGIETELQAGVWVMVAGCALGLIASVIAALSTRSG